MLLPFSRSSQVVTFVDCTLFFSLICTGLVAAKAAPSFSESGPQSVKEPAGINLGLVFHSVLLFDCACRPGFVTDSQDNNSTLKFTSLLHHYSQQKAESVRLHHLV